MSATGVRTGPWSSAHLFVDFFFFFNVFLRGGRHRGYLEKCFEKPDLGFLNVEFFQ